MRVSAKGRYGLAAMITMAQIQSVNSTEQVTIISIAERLGISKIYLEQVFALLKRAELVSSTKGSAGGYQLSRDAKDITAYDIISAIEQVIFEPAKKSLSASAAGIDEVMQTLVFRRVDDAISRELKAVTLKELAAEADQYGENLMFFI